MGRTLMLASAVRESEPDNGVDRALIAQASKVVGLETITGQLSIFDQLAEADQSDMLALTAKTGADASTGVDGIPQAAARAWFSGDMAALDGFVRQPLSELPALYDALLKQRNIAWATQIESHLAAGQRPFIAVGAGHMLGEDGLPALLRAQGYSVTRVEPRRQ